MTRLQDLQGLAQHYAKCIKLKGGTKMPTTIDTKKRRYIMVIDLDRCVGCQACTVACKEENHVDYGVFWNRVYKVGPEDGNMFYFPKQCMHCDEPLCVEVCPTKATYKADNGVVLVDHDKCYGCGYCTWACPYGARTLNPNKGMVEKCIMCVHLLEQGKKPACVSTCIGNCRMVGDINDSNSEVSLYLAQHADRVMKIHDDIGTKPSTVYLKPRKGASKL